MKKFYVAMGLYLVLSFGTVLSVFVILSRDCPHGRVTCVGQALGKGAAAFKRAYDEASDEKQDCRKELPDRE